jgi:hypothetical protein
MSVEVKTRRTQREHYMSALTPIADMPGDMDLRRNGPIAEEAQGRSFVIARRSMPEFCLVNAVCDPNLKGKSRGCGALRSTCDEHA